MNVIETNQGGGGCITSAQQLSVVDEAFPKLLEAVHHGDLKTVESTLAKYPALLNQADAQGNTPLHYAVAQHNLALIEFLIKPRTEDAKSADVTIKNQQGETAAQWYEEFIASIYNLEQLIDSKELRRVIEKNGVQIVTTYLKLGVSRSLRFSRGSTPLHLAVEFQRPAIVKVILEGISPEKIDRLLKLKNSQGDTPLDLAEQKLYPYATPVAQEIFTVLQQKQRTTAPEESASMSQPLPREWLFLIDKDFKNKINELANILKNLITADEFEQLNPFRVVICQLAYTTCRQALSRLSVLVTGPAAASSPKKKVSLEEAWFQNLFGNCCGDTKFKFQKKLEAIATYLGNLTQQQFEQVIHFSNQKRHIGGWYSPSENKIYLNPISEKNLIGLVMILIHEATHVINQSYDFATLPVCSPDKKSYLIECQKVYRLASTGESEELTPERIKQFELRQLLQEGISAGWRQRLNHWMALNNADTLTLAILLLATLPEKYAKLNKKQHTLLIKPQFLSAEYLEKHRAPLPLTAPCPPPLPEPQAVAVQLASVDQPGPSRSVSTKGSLGKSFGKAISNFFKTSAKQKVTNPCSPKRNLSNDSGERSTIASSTLSPSVQLPQTMAADIASAGQPEENPGTIPYSSRSDSDAGWSTTSSTSSRTPSPSVQLPQLMAAYSPSANQPRRSRAGSTNRRSLASISTLIPPGDRHSLASRTTLTPPRDSSDSSD